jgi:hypothetical protein
MPPYSTAYRYGDGPERRTGDQLAMRGNYPANRLPALRSDREAPIERAPRTSFQPAPAGAKPNPTLPNPPLSKPILPMSGRFAEEPPGRRVIMGPPARAPALPAPAPAAPMPLPAAATPVPAAAALPPPAPPARLDPPQGRTQPDMGYRVLPKSYWAGAAWRWRMKHDEDGFPRDPH